jgi:hypothetical protein
MRGSSKHTCVQTLIPHSRFLGVEFPDLPLPPHFVVKSYEPTSPIRQPTKIGKPHSTPTNITTTHDQTDEKGWIDFFLIGKRVSWEGWKTCLGRWMLSIIGVRYLLTPHVAAETGDFSWREVVETDADAMLFGCRIRLFRMFLVLLYCILPRHTLRVRACPQIMQATRKRTRENDWDRLVVLVGNER